MNIRKSNEIQIIQYLNSAGPQMANLDSSFSVGQYIIADPKYVLFESKSRNSQRKCSERPPENVDHEFKRNHFHICLFLRFRRLILIIQEHQTISMKFDDVINFQRKRWANWLERTILSRSMGNIYSCGPSSKYHFDCNTALTSPMRIKSCGLIKIPIEIIQLWPIAFSNLVAGLITVALK